MIYFSAKPVAPQSIDSSQFAELQAFKERLKPLGLIESFDDADQFRAKFAKQLQLTLIQNPYLQSLLRTSSAEDEEAGVGTIVQDAAPSLSVEARTLLKAAAERENGTILKIAYLGGRVIQAGSQKFGGDRGREAAMWENALRELEENDLVVARGYKGEVFELTHTGWQLADAL